MRLPDQWNVDSPGRSPIGLVEFGGNLIIPTVDLVPTGGTLRLNRLRRDLAPVPSSSVLEVTTPSSATYYYGLVKANNGLMLIRATNAGRTIDTAPIQCR